MCWWLQIRKDWARTVTGREATPGGGGAFLSDLSGNLGAQCLGPGRLETRGDKVLSGLGAAPAPLRGSREEGLKMLSVGGGQHGGDVCFVFGKWSHCFSSTTALACLESELCIKQFVNTAPAFDSAAQQPGAESESGGEPPSSPP